MIDKSENIFKYNIDAVKAIFDNKEKYRHKQAHLPIEEKIRILTKLQKMALTVKPLTGKNDKRTVWKLT